MRALAVALLLVWAASASAQQRDPDPVMVPRLPEPSFPSGKSHVESLAEMRTLDAPGKPILAWERLTGDWGGPRAALYRRGIFPELVYYTEVFSKLAGGASGGVSTRVLGKLDLSLSLDTSLLGWWEEGHFFVYFESLHGDANGINGPVGDPVDPVSSLNADALNQLGAYYWLQSFFDHRLAFKVGKQDANADFVSSPVSGEFVNGGASPPPNVPLPTFPDPALGFSVGVAPVDWASARAGVYGGEPSEGPWSDSGLFSGEVFSIFEIHIEPQLGAYQGIYRFGGWRLDADVDAVGSQAPRHSFSSNHGFYLLFDQPLWLEDPAGQGLQGLRGFLQLSWAPEDRNAVDVWVGGGLLYSGLLPSRPRDDLGFGVFSARPSKRLARRSNETVFEWYYKLRVAEWLHLTPDLQWFLDPAGDGRNAVALGLRMMVAF